MASSEAGEGWARRGHGASRTSECCGIWGALAFPFFFFFPFSAEGKQDTVLLSSVGSLSSLIDQKLHSNYVLRTYINYWFNFQTY